MSGAVNRSGVAIALALLVTGGLAGVAAWTALRDEAREAPGADVPQAATTRAPLPHRTSRLRTGAAAEAAAAELLGGIRRSERDLAAKLAEGAKSAASGAPSDGSQGRRDGAVAAISELDDVGRVLRQGCLVDGQRDGLWVEIDALGGRSETEYRAGKRHGREAAWRRDGTLRFVGTYDDGAMSGTWTSWHEGGVLHETREFFLGELQGAVREYHANGVLARESEFAAGKDTGPTTGWYDDGSVEYVMPYVKGRREGDAVWFHRNGCVAARGTYVDDALHGLYRSWTEDGTENPVEQWDHGVRLRAPALRGSAALGDVAPNPEWKPTR